MITSAQSQNGGVASLATEVGGQELATPFPQRNGIAVKRRPVHRMHKHGAATAWQVVVGDDKKFETGVHVMNIDPEYTIDYYDAIKMQLDQLSADERTELEFKVIEEFNMGATERQRTIFLQWMNESLAKKDINQGTAASHLNVERPRLNRWLTGTIDPQLMQVLKFYVAFGGQHENDHPLRERRILNLHGFLKMLVFLRGWLEEAGLTKAVERQFELPTLETFLALYLYYASTSPQEAFDAETDLEQEIASFLSQIAAYVPVSERRIQDHAEFRETVNYWGYAWLYGLTLIAEEVLGVEKYRVITKRLVKIDEL